MRRLLGLFVFGTATLLWAAHVGSPAQRRAATHAVEPVRTEPERVDPALGELVSFSLPPPPPPDPAILDEPYVARGRIEDETGAPVPTGKIRGMSYLNHRHRVSFAIRGSVRNGAYWLRRIRGGSSHAPPRSGGTLPKPEVSFHVKAPGFASQKFILDPEVAATLALGETVRGATLVLQRGAIVEGTVRGPDGQPLARVEVGVVDDPQEPHSEYRTRRFSDKHGHFRLVDLDPRRRLWIRADAEGLIAWPLPLPLLNTNAVTRQELFLETRFQDESNAQDSRAKIRLE